MPKTHQALHADKEKTKSKVELITEGYMVTGKKKDAARKKAKAVVKKKPAVRARRKKRTTR